MAKVSEIKVGNPRTRGEFKVEKYNLFEEEERNAYAELRNQAEDRTNGITIETIREYSRKSVTAEGDGDSRVVTTTEEIILVVHYWAKPLAVRSKGESNDETGDAKLAVVR